ncbi:hypothetical protein OBA37_02070 [Candidatus Pelagibacter sp.]|nr:hypothetical protein [Candidatus Pelagibacter sp.]
MKNNTNNKTLLFLTLNKFTLIVLDEFNKVIFKKELLLKVSSEKFNFELLDNFINQNIFKIEKELNEFVKIIILIIDHNDIFSVNLSIKNKINDVILNNNLINNLLIEAKSCCKETLEKVNVMHMKIDLFYIDNNIYKTLPDKIRFRNLSVDLSFICIPNNFLQNLEKVLNKYQISLGKVLSYKYLNSFIDIANNELGLVSKKILHGFNENEVIFTHKRSKNLSFFEKFFNFFN